MNVPHMTIAELVNFIRKSGDLLRPPVPIDRLSAMIFRCSVASEGLEDATIAGLIADCPDDLREFWKQTRSASLFEDVNYGQWGLVLLSPEASLTETDSFRQEREEDFIEGDLIIGTFLGDSDLLVIRCDPELTDYSSILVASPIDPRTNWFRVSGSLSQFLTEYVKSLGEKYWFARRHQPP